MTRLAVAFAELAAANGLKGFAVAVREWVAAAEALSEVEPPMDAERASLRMVEASRAGGMASSISRPRRARSCIRRFERRVGRFLNSQRQGDPSVEPLPVGALRAQALVDLADQDLRVPSGRPSRPDRYHVALTMNVDADGNVAAGRTYACGGDV